jgi:2,4-dienoyl-CoA reductase-like NADH-dependent reductase (Old Yellow Enzyme family)
MATFPAIATLKTAEAFQRRLAALGVEIPFDAEVRPDGPLAQPLVVDGRTVGNRFCILPMEGWDVETDGRPSERTFRRWRRFGASGAKLIWGGEAVAVRPDGRATPNELLIAEETLSGLSALREALIEEHHRCHGRTDDLLVGLQLTHSGRFAGPHQRGRLDPVLLYRHPILDHKFRVPVGHPLLTDDEITRLVDDFVRAARRAQRAGFDFVDIKHCHGYLGHEFLSAVDRPGRYGGNFENRTRFLREVVAGVRAEAPGLGVGVRLSVVDWIPFRKGPDGLGEPEPFAGAYRHAFGGDGSGVGADLTEPFRFLDLLASLSISLLCMSVGSPYYNPHIQRPALFPPSDGYLPPEDPLVGVARQIALAAQMKRHAPRLAVVGSGYSYLQEWLPHVGQAVVWTGGADFIGLGRMALSYPEMPADVLAGRLLRRKQICRTFSDCTTAPRNGLTSGCYPLDSYYKDSDDAVRLTAVKRRPLDGTA